MIRLERLCRFDPLLSARSTGWETNVTDLLYLALAGALFAAFAGFAAVLRRV